MQPRDSKDGQDLGDPHPLRPIADAWRMAVRGPRARLAFALVALACVVALLVAREGSGKARVAGAALIGGSALLAALAFVLERRGWGDPSRVIRRIALRVDPERAARALRALSLIEMGGRPRDVGTSADLAKLHVARALAALPADRIFERGVRVGRRMHYAAMAIGLAAATVTLVRAWSVLEGLDVLLAHGGTAPFSMNWLGDLEGRARPPDYLHMNERDVDPLDVAVLPYGTLITVRGEPLHSGRKLFLSDGKDEVPFVDDGTGRVVARWPLSGNVELRVVARFGGVTIPEDRTFQVRCIPDEAPVVELEGAPKQIELARIEEEEGGDIAIRYVATDDHGLREVHLVLRAGAREERRVLAKLDGDTRFDKGGHVLRARDPFIKKTHVPIEVRVEAKDNDPLTGPKWGASEAITLVPPDVGEPEARRLDALRALRDELVDLLAWRLGHTVPSDAAGARAYANEEMKRQDEAQQELDDTLASTYAGIRVPTRLQAMLRGKMRRLREAVNAEVRAPSGGTRDKAVAATESFVLVLDAIVRGLGQRDTRDAARQLADVADDLALGASQAQRGAQEKERGLARMKAAERVLDGGGRAMVRLGSLGRDIGEIVEVDLLRVDRASVANDMMHAELAAKDLATRLREPDPSFGSKGRSGRAGGESGGDRGTPGDEAEEPDEAQQAFNEAAQELERIAQDHAGEIGQVEQDLAGASSQDEIDRMKDEAMKHAQNIREAAKPLPSVGAGSDSWTSKGAAAKEHAEQMAGSLEHGNPADAVQSGKRALEALDEAKRIAQRSRWFGDQDKEEEQALEESRQKLEKEEQWAEQQLQQLRKRAAERAASQLQQRGDEEGKLAQRMGQLGEKGRDQGEMPQQALESLDDAEKSARDASEALKRGDADKALEKQRDAQRKLEMAEQALGQGEQDKGQEEGDEGNPSLDHADIPKADQHKGPEEFRRRVMQGLGQPSSGRLDDATRRYAEGLLR